jgi:hypothetical protein
VNQAIKYGKWESDKGRRSHGQICGYPSAQNRQFLQEEKKEGERPALPLLEARGILFDRLLSQFA